MEELNLELFQGEQNKKRIKQIAIDGIRQVVAGRGVRYSPKRWLTGGEAIAYFTLGYKQLTSEELELPEDLAQQAAYVVRKSMAPSIRDLDSHFLSTSKEECLDRILSGDISQYALPEIFNLVRAQSQGAMWFISKIDMFRLPDEVLITTGLLEYATDLPIKEVMDSRKTIFPCTHEYKKISDAELKNTVEKGLNKWIELARQFYDYTVKIGYYVENAIELFGQHGVFFGGNFSGETVFMDSKWDSTPEHGELSEASPLDLTRTLYIFTEQLGVDLNKIDPDNMQFITTVINEFLEAHAKDAEKHLEIKPTYFKNNPHKSKLLQSEMFLYCDDINILKPSLKERFEKVMQRIEDAEK